jgi:DNA-binding HxlR family transcriptional regulator
MRKTVTGRSTGRKRALSSTRYLTEGSAGLERTGCPLYTAIAVIDGRWKPMIFQRLEQGSRGFGELRRAMPGVARKVLREQLRQMQADGLLVRRPLGPATAGVRYRLTPYGRTLAPVFAVLWRWGSRHLARRNAALGTVVLPPAVRDAVGR